MKEKENVKVNTKPARDECVPSGRWQALPLRPECHLQEGPGPPGHPLRSC